MRIGIDYTAALRQEAGIGRYTRELVRALAQLDTKNEYLLFFPLDTPGMKQAASGLPPNFSLKRIPLTERALNRLWHRLRLPLPVELFTGRLSLLHSPDFVLPPQWRGRSVVTIHDLSFLKVRQCAPAPLRRYLEAAVPRAVERADLVLADSFSTRDDLVELLGMDPARVEVVYPAAGKQFQPIEGEEQRERVRAKYSLPQHFILNLGTLEPRKNQARLIRAYSLLKLTTALPHHLVIAGRKGWLWEDIFSAARDSGFAQQIHFPGYVPEKDLPTLYSLADLFAFPTLYEGFGLPALEAMACGTAVVSSNTSSLPEVVGEAGLLAGPLDVRGLAAAMEKVLENESLRRELVQKGRDQARRFSWQKSAKKLLILYEGLVESG